MLKIILLIVALAQLSSAGITRPKRFFETDPYVVGGIGSYIEDYPFMVSIYHDRYRHNCGGSILSEYWVLSAAHCSGVAIEYGTAWVETSTNVIDIKQWIRHERYNREYEYDIAVVELQKAIPISRFSEPVKMPPPMYEVPGSWSTKAILTGWGLDNTGGNWPDRLQEVELLVVSNRDCQDIHEYDIYNSNLCAGVKEGGKGQCTGDSGGPLTVKGVQVGIVSWSVKPCAVAPYPGVYTKVSHFVTWIEDKTGLRFNYVTPTV